MGTELRPVREWTETKSDRSEFRRVSCRRKKRNVQRPIRTHVGLRSSRPHVNRDFKIRDYRRLDVRSPMSGGMDRVRSVVGCCGAKTQIKLLHYQLRTTRNYSSRIHLEDVFPKSQR